VLLELLGDDELLVDGDVFGALDGVLGVDGGVLGGGVLGGGVLGGGVGAVGHVSVLAITEPSGHVCVFVGGGGVGVIPCSFASPMSQSLVLRFLSRSVMALLSARSHTILSTHL